MKNQLHRVKQDVETIQKAMGLLPSMGREWVVWMKRDRWFSLWWCLPGILLIVASLLPPDPGTRYLGFARGQWAGILVATTLLGIAIGLPRAVSRKDGRPAEFIRESKRRYGMNAQGLWFGLALSGQLLCFLFWARQNYLGFEAIWGGSFLLAGSTCLVTALAARGWILMGYAIPFLAYGLCVPFVREHHTANGVLFGAMFIAVALSFSFIQAWQIHQLECRHESN